ncbi:PIN domain nuclease [Mycolicibacterium sp. YH-1]|uniref:PIN domain nuclease n=1 Tax=Mycolicibacterium sp. YH-1 TaxID=2908837 RepID=UPI001F4BE406|nr:PIN domain nuclease [Mycolicibacterium sp. YH-1]UNB50688.1 PIN domain nuclease [Mycolicibacterium sp. YH-1]
MALTARFLIDTSAAARMQHPHVGGVLGELIEAGLVATTAALDAEALYSARSADEFARLRDDRRKAFEYIPTNDEDWQSAIDAQYNLALSGRHRSVGVADLLNAVIAGRHGLTILHYDRDFDTAADVLEFGHRWVAERGTL